MQQLYVPKALFDFFKQNLRADRLKKSIKFLLWNWRFLYYNPSERLALPSTQLFCQHMENEQVKRWRDKPAPKAKLSHISSKLPWNPVVVVVVSHTPNIYTEFITNKDPCLITVCSSSSSTKTVIKLKSQRLGWSLNISTYFKLDFCYARR